MEHDAGVDRAPWLIPRGYVPHRRTPTPTATATGAAFRLAQGQGAEGTGIYFGKDPDTLCVNVQHSGTGNDKNVAITRRRD